MWSTPFPSDPHATSTIRGTSSSSHTKFPSQTENTKTRLVTFGIGVFVAGFTLAAALYTDYDGDNENATEERIAERKRQNEEKRKSALEKSGPVTVGLEQMDQVAESRKNLGVWVWGSNAEGTADPSRSRSEVIARPTPVEV
jgi:hypothetical protein